LVPVDRKSFQLERLDDLLVHVLPPYQRADGPQLILGPAHFSPVVLGSLRDLLLQRLKVAFLGLEESQVIGQPRRKFFPEILPGKLIPNVPVRPVANPARIFAFFLFSVFLYIPPFARGHQLQITPLT
jgi:hypothetical protein